MLSPENRALVDADDWAGHLHDTCQPLTDQALNRILDAAREQGREEVRDQWAERDAGESI